MTKVSVVTPASGEVIQLGPTKMRILEDGSTTDHRPRKTVEVMSRYATVAATDYA